jgi:hypothetical protein
MDAKQIGSTDQQARLITDLSCSFSLSRYMTEDDYCRDILLALARLLLAKKQGTNVDKSTSIMIMPTRVN